MVDNISNVSQSRPNQVPDPLNQLRLAIEELG